MAIFYILMNLRRILGALNKKADLKIKVDYFTTQG